MKAAEEWKPVFRYENSYQVSNLGNVRSIIKSKIINQYCHKYCRVSLTNGSKATNFLVHRLVAEAFITNPENKPQINHINGIKNDNRAENSEWVTQSENMLHAYNTGLATAPKGDRHYAKKGSDFINGKSKAIINTETNVIYASIAKASIASGIPSKSLAKKLLGTRTNNTSFRYVHNPIVTP